MNTYTAFAKVYESFMDNIPYKDWTDFVTGIMKENNVKDGAIVCELGCGTGTMTRLFKKAGYDMIGIDISEEMLDVARYDHQDESEGILYLNQDMREFELYGTVGAVVSLCDSMNYVTEKEDLLKVFKLVNNYLDPEGLFVFDMKTVHTYKDLMGNRTITDNRDESTLIWENRYDEKTRENNYNITIYTKAEFENDEEDDGLPPLFEREEECHVQKAYEIGEIKELLKEAGLELVAVYADGKKQTPDEKSERVYYVAKETYQEGKSYIPER